MMRNNEKGTFILCIYMDDVLLIGDIEAIHSAINDIEQKNYIWKEGLLKDYLGCIIEFKDSEGSIYQPHSIKRLESKFKDLTKDIRKITNPCIPGALVMRPKEGDELIATNLHYKSLLRLIK